LSLFPVFQDIEREAMMQLHAGGTQDRTQRARRTALFADYFADILMGDTETYYRGFVVVNHFYRDIFGLVYQRLDDFQDELFHQL